MDRDLVSDVKARLTIEEVIGGYIPLKRTGTSYKALSPFKEEKTPSLIVTPSKELWKDFSSGKGGDLFKFVMEYEGVEFRQALEILALKAGLDLSQYQGSPRTKILSSPTEDLFSRPSVFKATGLPATSCHRFSIRLCSRFMESFTAAFSKK